MRANAAPTTRTHIVVLQKCAPHHTHMHKIIENAAHAKRKHHVTIQNVHHTTPHAHAQNDWTCCWHQKKTARYDPKSAPRQGKALDHNVRYALKIKGSDNPTCAAICVALCQYVLRKVWGVYMSVVEVEGWKMMCEMSWVSCVCKMSCMWWFGWVEFCEMSSVRWVVRGSCVRWDCVREDVRGVSEMLCVMSQGSRVVWDESSEISCLRWVEWEEVKWVVWGRRK